jgi:hypothetical protein
MNRNFTVLFATFLILIGSCKGIDCEGLPEKYQSYEEAIKVIKAANFRIEETVNTSKSSWVKGASYHSCNGISGFFILETAKKEYIYSGVDINTWEGFKNASSFGSFYNEKIKGKFKFYINQ